MFRNNKLVIAASHSKLRLHPIVAVVIFVILLILGEIAFAPIDLAYKAILSRTSLQIPMVIDSTLTRLFFPFLATSLIFFAYIFFVERRPIVSIGFFPDRFLSRYLRGFGIGVGLMLTYMLFALILGVYRLDTLKFQAITPGLIGGILIPLVGWIVQGASEEIITRGWLFQATIRKRVMTGMIISSSIFAMLHLGNHGITALSIINLILYGTFAMLYALKEESLWGICGFHSSWNWAQGNLLGISVSGNSILGSSLITPGTANGSDLLTGALFGAEGSILVTLLLLLSCSFIVWRLYLAHKIETDMSA